MVVGCVEKPLLQVILDHAQGNQTRAAEILGLNRNTLRKKMKTHGIK
jgi:Fis family transcriptional regulator